MILLIMILPVFLKESASLSAELHQDRNAVLGSNSVQLSCNVQTEDGDVVDSVSFYSKLDGSSFKRVIAFEIDKNTSNVVDKDGDYLKGRVTLINLISSENRTIVEYNRITCEDNGAYTCSVGLVGGRQVTSLEHVIEVKGIPAKPDRIPIRLPDVDTCQGMNVNFTCNGNIGKPPGYYRWTKFINGINTTYNDAVGIDTEIQGTCVFNRTSTLSIEVQKEDNNATFRCEVIHELATSEMYQETIPQTFVYDPYEYTVITKEPDKIYYDPTTPFIELTCFAKACYLPNYTWYKDTDLNDTIGNESIYRISDVNIQNSGNYVCIVDIMINGTEEKYNQTVTIDIRNLVPPEQLPIEEGDFADSTAGIATIAVVSVGGAVLTSIVLFKIIQKVKHVRLLKTIGVKDVETVNVAEPDKDATQAEVIDDEGFVSEVSQQ